MMCAGIEAKFTIYMKVLVANFPADFHSDFGRHLIVIRRATIVPILNRATISIQQ